MNRIDVINNCIKQINAKSYLEIGTSLGETFFSIKCLHKIGIDPFVDLNKMPPARLKLRWLLYKFNNLLHDDFYRRSQTFLMTSDEFFERLANPIIYPRNLDVAFIDGLHTYQQALKDIENCLKYLSPKGVIIIHDCKPTTEAMAYPAKSFEDAKSKNLPGWTGEWCGDVWKVIPKLRERSDLKIEVLNYDYGLGVIRWNT
jgi:hypothetical protein